MTDGTLPPPNAPIATPDGGEKVAWWKKKRAKLPTWAWIAIAVVVIGAAASAGGGDEDTSGDDTTTATSEAATATSVADETAPEATEPEPEITEPAVTEAPTTTVAPTTIASTTTLPPAPLVFEGTGDDVIDLGGVLDQPQVVVATNSGTSNFIVYSLDAGLTELDLIVNTIGPSLGRYPMNFQGDAASFLRVEAEGNWRFEIQELSPTAAPVWDGTAPYTGAGSDVILYNGDAGILDYTNTGDSNFIVTAYGDSSDLLVNEIGPVDGTTTITAGPMAIVIAAEGDWSFTVRPV